MKVNNEEELVVNNIRLVYYIVKKFNFSQSEYEDVVECGILGLVKAARTFDKSKGKRFSTYAGRCIQNEIGMYFRKHKKCLDYVYLDEDIPELSTEGGKITLKDIIKSPEESIEERILREEEFMEILNIIINMQDSKKRAIVLLSLEQDRQITIAEKFNLTQSAISRILKECYAEIRRKYEDGYKPFFKISKKGKGYVISFPIKEMQYEKMQTSLALENAVKKKGRVEIRINKKTKQFTAIEEIMQRIESYK